jgi:hypothetical protein
METSQAILRQLRWIKWSAVVIAISFAAIAGGLTAISLSVDEAIEEETDKDTFSARALELLEQGKERDVLQLSSEREKTHPKDPNVFWYRAKAQYQMNQYAEALVSLRKTEDLAPTWHDETTQPFIKGIERKMESAK